MKLVFVCFILFFTVVEIAVSQDIQIQVKYDKNFIFQDGIYFSFEEFKNNRPSVTDFKAVKSSSFSGQVELEYSCVDEKSGELKTCIARTCWGYALNNNIFIAQGVNGYFFRLHIIGALIHYFSVEQFSMDYYDYAYGYPSYRTNRGSENREYVLEFDTGKKFEFNYREFSDFLLKQDKELYDELQSTKKKKKMIYHFLLKYNERHSIYLNK